MKITFRVGTLLAASIAMSMMTPLRATTITSTSVSSWLNTVVSGSAQDVAFNPNPNADYSNSLGYTASGFTYTGPDGAGFYLKGVYFSGNSLQSGSDSAAQLVATTPTGGETALLFSFTSTPAASGYILSLSDGESFNLSSSTNIFGVSVSHPITSATLTTTAGSHVVLQGMSYGTTNLPLDSTSGGSTGTTPDPSATPEASTTLLLASGLLIMAKFRRGLFGFGS